MTSANNASSQGRCPQSSMLSGGEKPSGSNFIRDIIVRDLRNFASGGAPIICMFPFKEETLRQYVVRHVGVETRFKKQVHLLGRAAYGRTDEA